MASRQAWRALLRRDGAGLELLGHLVRARTIIREKLLGIDLAKDEGVKAALRLQGQAKGIDLAIDAIFDIANFEEPSDEATTGQ